MPRQEFVAGGRNFLSSGNRAITIIPMMRGDEAIGLLSVVRLVAGPLSDKQLAVLRTFANKPSSPSRTRGCSTSCASVRMTWRNPSESCAH
jgi:hypothetical protein